MHPDRKTLKEHVEHRLDEASARNIGNHLKECELCREFCEYYGSLVESIRSEEAAPLTEKAIDLAEKLYSQPVELDVVSLIPLTAGDGRRLHLIAADSDESEKEPEHDYCLRTFYSESPEVVLRVMRDPQQKRDYMHVASEDRSLSSGVLVQLPELNLEFATDESGYASIGSESLGDYSQLRWQIKMPSAVFSLAPLEYDREAVEYAQEVTLQTEKEDEVQVKFEGMPETKRITVRVVKLGGQADFGNLRVVVSQKRVSTIAEASPEKSIAFNIDDPDDVISIRIYK